VPQEENIVSGMAGRYAQALYALAVENNAADQVAADLKIIADLIADSADMRAFLKSPVFTSDVQLRIINAILAKTAVSGMTANFIRLVASKRRLFALNDMINGFNALSDAAHGVRHAQVTLAQPANNEQIAQLQNMLKQVSGGTSVNMAIKIDPSIIGGIIVKLGSRMVDGSLKTKLNSIRTRMKEVG
jgi:F-type H+-transporting ATPase subunit delta